MHILDFRLLQPLQVSLLQNLTYSPSSSKRSLNQLVLLIYAIFAINIQHRQSFNLHKSELLFIHAKIIALPKKVLDLCKVYLIACDYDRKLFGPLVFQTNEYKIEYC